MKAGDVLYRTGDLAAVVQGVQADGKAYWYRWWDRSERRFVPCGHKWHGLFKI
tara:strand:- start:1549 stop:1707 length:159 start_codon:yes stop_codon:yes gene_type:complete